MSRRSQKRKLKDPRRRELVRQYWRAYSEWANSEPSCWRIVAWLKWRARRPHMPKWVEEYDELHERYCRLLW